MTESAIRLHRICPLCKSKTGSQLCSLDFAAQDNNFLPRHYNIVCCNSCSFIYNDYSEPDSVFEKHYAESGKYAAPELFGGGGLSPEENQMWGSYYNTILPYIRNSNMKILEIGCGKGGFLKYLKKHGHYDLYGLEPSVECVQQLRKAKFQMFDDWRQIGDQKFDLVVANAVFEHLPNPREMMDHIANVLSDDGLLFIAVPDSASYLKYCAAPFYYFDREHINHFTRSSLKLLSSLHSFDSLTIQILKNDSLGPMKFHYDLAGVFQLKKKEMSNAVRQYIYTCKKKKIHLPSEIFSAEHVFLWGLGAFAENLLFAGYFNAAKNLHFLDVDISKQGKMIFGKTVDSPESLLNFDPEKSAVVITSVLYKDKIIESLLAIGFRGKYFTVYQE